MIPLVPLSQCKSELDSVSLVIADCVEAMIYNALCLAETVEGRKGRKIEVIYLGQLKKAEILSTRRELCHHRLCQCENLVRWRFFAKES